MPADRALQRLLRVLSLEEEQYQAALEDALAGLRRLEATWQSAEERERFGRRLIGQSALAGQVEDRLAGIEEGRAALRLRGLLEPRIAAAESDVAQRRAEFLAKRVERRQAETLLEEAEARAQLDRNRRSQASLDEWYLSRKRNTAPTGDTRRKPTPPPRPFDLQDES